MFLDGTASPAADDDSRYDSRRRALTDRRSLCRLRRAGGLVECRAGDGVTSGRASVGLPAAHDHVDVKRIEFEPTALSADAFCGHQRRAGAQEGIEDDIAASRTVENGVSDH